MEFYISYLHLPPSEMRQLRIMRRLRHFSELCIVWLGLIEVIMMLHVHTQESVEQFWYPMGGNQFSSWLLYHQSSYFHFTAIQIFTAFHFMPSAKTCWIYNNPKRYKFHNLIYVGYLLNGTFSEGSVYTARNDTTHVYAKMERKLK